MSVLTASMEGLVNALKKLPGVGPRTAERFAFYLLTQPASIAQEMAQAILKIKQTVGFCKTCFNLADEDHCTVCRDPGRDKSVVCVVEHPRGIIAIEKSGGYKGVYHVLLGALSPLDAIGPKDLKIQELKERIKQGGIKEVILATDSDLEGEATSLYLGKELRALSAPASAPVQITRLAAGIPMGSAIEYADQVTLIRAMEGRRAL
ncbi:MAG: recombination protein RecR [Candidatus Omnitrophica bacterium]|nr:recombination protein RecR [Candidatus Omnitrophota bacterium]